MANEKRLIDANELLRVFEPKAWESVYIQTDTVVAEIKTAPTVDAAEVVRCKDCIYATAEDGDLYCDGPIGIFGTVGFNDFCSYGERRSDG